MKIDYSLIIIIILFTLLSGCSKHDFAAAVYYSLNAISDSRNGIDSKTLDDPKYSGNTLKIMNDWESYNSYQRKREKRLKEGQISEKPGDFRIYRDMSPEITLEEITGDIGFFK